ncbi:Protein ALP1-like [Merluccius polli]|uniref:Protein ALP1-like n=1 Tax=Merluccius polli TaxID=89951 RepID=A0AA47MWM1_MERPO|nr:Protein ALP1-like [Merluccius polli]
MDPKDIALVALYLRRRRRRRRSIWVHPTVQRRYDHGEYHRLVSELRLDEVRFQQYFRLNRTEFDELLLKVVPLITKTDTSFRSAISPGERLAICLRYLATGDSFRTIAFSYRVGHSTVAGIVSEVSRAIWDCLVAEVMPVPTKDDWREIAAEFSQRWQFPNCVGSIDGKRVQIQAPNNTGSQFFNYKGTFSIVLLAVVDAKYCFRLIDVGNYGRASDGGTLANSAFGRALQDGTLSLPADFVLPAAEDLGPLPHVFVADEAFPLRRNLMRPFPGIHPPGRKRTFNYRLSRARLVVEDTFGILAAQWRMYHRVLGVSPDNAEACVKATCVLHNFIRRMRPTLPQSEPQDGTSALNNIRRAGSNNATQEAIQVREKFATYFSA